MCPHEADFDIIYEHAAPRDEQSAEDRAAQLAVLTKNPQSRHCELWQVQPNACDSCIHNPHLRTDGDEMQDIITAWSDEIHFAQIYIRRQRAGIAIREPDLLRFEAELAVVAHEVVQEREADEALLKVPQKDLTPEQRERRRELLIRGKVSNRRNRKRG